MARGVPGPVVRRSISIPTLLVASVLTVTIGPVALALALVVDLVTLSRSLRRTRTVVLIGTLVLVDLAGFVLVMAAWLSSPFGYRIHRARPQRWLRWIMTTWTTGLMAAITRICPIELRWEELDDDVFAPNAILVGHHRSLLDAILPAVVIGGRGLTPMYTLKEDLRWEPNIDIVGHAMHHRFVTRSPKNLEAELDPIRELGTRIDETSIGVIFPEGTFFTEARKEKIVGSLERRSPTHAALATQMRYMLAPRPGGTLALLDGAADADVILFAHAGFDRYGSLAEILRSIGTSTTITLRAWRHDRSTIPVEREARIDWLFERWLELDTWVASVHDRAAAVRDDARADESPGGVLTQGEG